MVSIKETAVIIPCWIIDKTLEQLTQRCIQSIRETSDVELVLVDNGSVFGKDMLEAEADILIRNECNAGYVRAINQGIVASSGKYIVCGNNDYMMTPGWEEALRRPLDEISFAGIVCPHVKGSLKKDTCWVENGTPGGWYMIKRETIDRVGLLDEQFFNVFADFDFCWRMMRLGLKIISTPFITVVHHGEASLNKFLGREREWGEGRRLLIKKWHNNEAMIKMLREVGLLGPSKST